MPKKKNDVNAEEKAEAAVPQKPKAKTQAAAGKTDADAAKKSPQKKTASPKKKTDGAPSASAATKKEAPRSEANKKSASGTKSKTQDCNKSTVQADAEPKPTATRKRTVKPKAEPIEEIAKEPVQDVSAPVEPQEEKAPEAPELPALVAPAQNLPVLQETTREMKPSMPPIAFQALKKERGSFFGRVLVLLLAAAVLFGAVMIFVYRPTLYSEQDCSVLFLYNSGENKTSVLYNGKLLKGTYNGECSAKSTNVKGNVCAALIGGKLYLVDGKKVSEISAGVRDFLLSQNGEVLVYRTLEDELFYVSIGRKLNIDLVSQNVVDGRYCISPSGEELFYTRAVEDKIHADVYTPSGKKPNFARTTGMIPVAISDGYKHIFYYNELGDLYYMNKKGAVTKYAAKGEGELQLLFDREFEEVLITSERGMILWQEGKQTIIPQLRAGEFLQLQANQRAVKRTLVEGEQYMISSFSDNYYLKNGADGEGEILCYLDGGELKEVHRVQAASANVCVTDKGVYFLERVDMSDEVHMHLCRCELGKTKAERLVWDVEAFCVNGDGSHLLFVRTGHLLSAALKRGKLDSRRLYSTVDKSSLCVTHTNLFYYRVGDKLYSSKNGADPQELERNVSLICIDAHVSVFAEMTPEGSGWTVYTNYRNRSKTPQVATGIVSIK